MDKYYRFERYLNTKIEEEFELTFAEIERISGVELPYSAYNYKEYWNPNGHTFATIVEMHDYRMKADLSKRKVLFYKEKTSFKSTEPKKDKTKLKEISNINYDYKIDESEFSKLVDKFIYIYATDANSRYMSYDHIRKAFLYNREKESARDFITLNLYAYLASWGMLRNSFLMQKDYTFSRPVVDVLCSDKYKSLINYNPFIDNSFKKTFLMEELVLCVFRRNQATYLGECRPVISAIVGHFSELY